MVLQVVLNKDGNYEYKDVAPPKATPVLNNEFEAYEKKQETTLAGDTNIGEQTQQLIRETPGQYTTTFNEETGQFETKTKGTEITPISVDTSNLQATAEDPNKLTPLQQVERLTAATRPQPIDYAGVAKDAVQMFKPTLKEKAIDTALQAGSDIAVSYITNKLLSKTFAGSLAAQAPFMTNPYTAAASLALDTGIGKEVLSGAKSVAKKVVSAPKKIIKAATGKVVCTMMNDAYGFGSFRNTIWLRYAKQNLTKEHEKGYHKIFLPLVKYAKQKGFTNKIIKNILEHVAIHRTIDIRKQEKNKIHLLGRIYRKILEPICYWAGK